MVGASRRLAVHGSDGMVGAGFDQTGTDGCFRYNLDAVNGEPFKGRNVTVVSEGAPSIEWPNGEDMGDATRDNAADEDIVLVISGKA